MQDIVIGRHRDTDDRIAWFLGVKRYDAALALAEADPTLPRSTVATVVQVRASTIGGTVLVQH